MGNINIIRGRMKALYVWNEGDQLSNFQTILRGSHEHV